MSRGNFVREEKAVSPVIGVILMVAITVILAAVIASFVFGLGAKAPKSAPQAQLTLSDASDNIDETGNTTHDTVFVLEHKGGDSIAFGQMKVLVKNSTMLLATITFDNNGIATNTTGSYLNATVSDNAGANSMFDAGEWITFVELDDKEVTSGDTLTVQVIDTQSNQLIVEGDVVVS